MRCQKSLSFFFFIFFFCVSCQSSFYDSNTKEYLKQYSDQKQPLVVDYHMPDGSVGVSQNKVVIHFTQPMVALSQVEAEVKTDFVKLEPEVPGYFKWVNTKTLVYQVKGDLPFATDFKVTVIAGRESLLGFALLKDFEFSFSTPSPVVSKVYPTDGSKSISLHGPFTVTFNQDVDVRQLSDKLFLSYDANVSAEPKKVNIDIRCNDADPQKDPIQVCSNVMALPTNELPKNSNIKLTVLKGIKGEQGDNLSKYDFNYSFVTRGDFFVTMLECKNSCPPNATLKVAATTPIDTTVLNQFVEFQPPVDNVKEFNAYWSSYSQDLVYHTNLKPFTDYSITFKKGLKDQFGQELQEAKSFQFKTAHFSPQLFLSYISHQIFHFDENNEFGFSAMNVKSVDTFFKEGMTDKEIVNFLFQPETNIRSLHAKTNFWTFQKKLIGSKVDSKEAFHLPVTDIVGSKKNIILLSDFISPEVTGYDNKTQTNYPIHHWLFRQVTDIAIDTKLSRDDGMVWVTSLTTGKNIGDAKVTVYDAFGNILFESKTDVQGIVKIPGYVALNKKSKSFRKENKNYSFLIFVHHKDDRAFMDTDWMDGLGYYYYAEDFGDNYDYEEYNEEGEGDDVVQVEDDDEEIKQVEEDIVKTVVRAHVLTDRGLYKPGEEVKIKGYMRQVTDTGLKEFIEPILVTISEQGSKKKTNIEVTPNERGNFAVSFSVPDNARLGEYRVSIQTKNKAIQFRYATTSFEVLKFRTPEFKLEINFANGQYFKGEQVQADVSSEYLFGAPMKNVTLDYFLTKQIIEYNPKNDKNWRFGRLAEHQETDDERLQNFYLEKKATLNDKGAIHLDFDTEKDVIDPVRFQMEGEVFDFSGQSQAGYRSVVVHPASFYIGAKVNSLFHNTNEAMSIYFATLSPDGGPVLNKQVAVDLIRVKWVSVKKETLKGQFETITERKEERVNGCLKITDQKENFCDFTVGDSGYYFFRLSSKDEQERVSMTEVPVYVSGSGYSYWSDEDSNELKLVSEKKEYEAGETAKILVKSPYSSGHALISIERDKIISYEVKELTGSAPVIEVPVLAKYSPNIFVKVLLIRGALEKDPSQNLDSQGQSQALVKAGLVELSVKPHNKNLSLKITPSQKIYKPGDTAKLDFEVSGKGAEITVMVVDEGVLLAGGYELKNPLLTLYAPYQHKMSQSDSRTRYVGIQGLAEKLEDPSSGGGKMTGFRKDFIPLAYFNGSLITDAQGKASVSFPIPDQLTTFKIMAIANANVDQFGLGQAEFQTQKDIMIRPALPRFVRAGDTIRSQVVIHNNTDQDLKVNMIVETENLDLISEQTASILVSKHQSLPYAIEFHSSLDKVTQAIDTLVQDDTEVRSLDAKVNITAQASHASDTSVVEDKVSISLPVYLDRLEETVATSGVSFDTVSEFVEKSSDMDQSFGSLDIAVSANLLSKLRDKIHLLRIYPYECLEQRISKIYPLVLFPHNRDFFEGKEKEDSYRRQLLGEVIDFARRSQTYNGEFKFWPNSPFANSSLTLTVAEFLIHAKKERFDVDDMLQKIENRLFAYLNSTDLSLQQRSEDYRRSLKLHSLYILYLLEKPQPSYYPGIKSEWNALGPVEKARFVEMLFAQDALDPFVKTWEDELQKQLRIKGRVAYMEPSHGSYYFGDSAKVTTARILQSLLQVDPSHPFVFQLLLGLVDQKTGFLYASSLESVEIIKTMRIYQETFPDVSEPVLMKMMMNNKEVMQSTLTMKKPSDQLNIPIDKLPERVTLQFNKENGHVLFYDVKYHYALKDFRPYGIEQGITINRTFYDLEDNQVDPKNLKQAGTYKVVLSFFFADQTDYLVVDEPVAAGLEPVDFALKTTRQGLKSAEDHSSLGWFLTHKEFHDKKILLFLDSVPRGFFEFTYFVKVTNAGDYLLPPAHAMEMYDPEIFGTTGKAEVKVQ